jgi:acyl-CoA dehydrogenase
MNAPEALIQNTAQRLFQQLESSPGSDTPDAVRGRWAQIEATGLDRILVPEAAGGFGAHLVDVVAVLRCAGSCAVEAPLMEAIAARWLFASAGLTEPHDLVVLCNDVSVAADGTRHAVIAYGRAVARACVVDTRGTAANLVVFDVDVAALEHGEDLAGEPRDRMEVPATAHAHLLNLTQDRIAGLCALLRAAQMLGAMERALDIAIEHANARQQFGRPIGQFQAVQQMLSVLAGQVAVVAAAVDGATAGMRDQAAWIGGALAKARASEAVATVNGVAHQVTAAMGFSREFPLHRFTRRLWAWRDEYGSEQAWHERIGGMVLERGGEGLWPLLVNPEEEGRAA